MISEEFKTILRGAFIRELDVLFQLVADEIKKGKIDRSKTFEEQGLESFANEMAADKLLEIINKLKQEVEPLGSAKKVFKT